MSHGFLNPPIFIGSFTDFTGSYIPALSVVAIMPLLMIISGLFLPETGKLATERQQQTFYA